MKLYLPIVSVVAALSNRKDSFDFDLELINDFIGTNLPSLSYFADIFR